MANQKFATYFLPSFPPPIQAFGGRLQRESIGFENKWIPARARLRGLGRNDGNLCNELATHHTSAARTRLASLSRARHQDSLKRESTRCARIPDRHARHSKSPFERAVPSAQNAFSAGSIAVRFGLQRTSNRAGVGRSIAGTAIPCRENGALSRCQ